MCVFDFDSVRVTQKKSFDRRRKKIYSSSRLPGFFSTFQSSRLMSDTACFPPPRKFAFQKKTENSPHISDLSARVSDRFHATLKILFKSYFDFSILALCCCSVFLMRFICLFCSIFLPDLTILQGKKKRRAAVSDTGRNTRFCSNLTISSTRH